MFTVIPAIDLKDGRCVRLRQGRADDVTVFSEDPVAMAMNWQTEGAAYLHVVDLDGAMRGHPVHTGVIGDIAGALSIPVEVGGGLRTDADIRSLLDRGVDRVILGTRAFADPASLTRLVEEFEDSLAVGIDARDGLVRVEGWVQDTGRAAADLAAEAGTAGVRTLIYTDIATDGMMRGTNPEAVAGICDLVAGRVIASGGITSPDDIRRLKALRRPNLVGAIVGRALYEGRVGLRDLFAAAEED
ncbi:1-(5-phosphoribosyl)-5-[(5-phosphoribosylamino)methylideneamino]imidazole-4-carboxamide isomerase [Verrucomicrobiota bacterium]